MTAKIAACVTCLGATHSATLISSSPEARQVSTTCQRNHHVDQALATVVLCKKFTAKRLMTTCVQTKPNAKKQVTARHSESQGTRFISIATVDVYLYSQSSSRWLHAVTAVSSPQLRYRDHHNDILSTKLLVLDCVYVYTCHVLAARGIFQRTLLVISELSVWRRWPRTGRRASSD